MFGFIALAVTAATYAAAAMKYLTPDLGHVFTAYLLVGYVIVGLLLVYASRDIKQDIKKEEELLLP